MTNTYQEKANNLAKAIDVAIDAIQKYCPSPLMNWTKFVQ